MIVDIPLLHKKVVEIIEKTDEMLKKAYNEETELLWKEGVDSSNAILTKTDQEIDAFLRQQLLQAFPDFGFITEEDKTTKLQEYNWIIDPIDGTGNFAHNIPLFGTSIALWKENEPVYGIISFPIFNERVHAIAGQGLFLNEKQFTRHALPKPKPFGSYGFVGSVDQKLAFLSSVKDVVGIPNSFHSAVFQYASVSLGRIDFSITAHLALWDFAAGLLLAQEAGLICEFVGAQPDIHSDEKAYKYTLVIAEKELADKIVGKLQ